MKKILVSLAGLFAMATAADAHVGVDHANDIVHGFLHPATGADHVLAMVAVGLLASMFGGRARWAVPLSFVAMMILGGVWGALGLAMPFVEVGILLSVVVLGAIVALEVRLPDAAAAALVGGFAVFHGVAHGAEMPVDASGLGYGLGFVGATALLHLAGFGLGRSVSRFAKIGGFAIVLAGVGMAFG